MVSPNPIPAAGTGSGGPPLVNDPYGALIDALPLPDEIVTLLKPTFDQLGCPLELDRVGVTDFGNKPLPHYRAETGNGKIVLLHVGEEIGGNAFGQISLITIASSFLKRASALFVFSEVDSFAFNTEDLAATWQQAQPTLKVRFVTLPLIQQLEFELDREKRIQNVRGLLTLDDLLAVNQISLDELVEKAYKHGNLNMLDNLKGLPERLSEGDRTYLIDFLSQLAISPPLNDSKRYFQNLLSQLGLETKVTIYIISSFNGNAYSDSEGLLLWLEDRTYPNVPMQGYRRVLGYLLSLLADQGGGRRIALIIFKYKLVETPSSLHALVAKYP